MNNSILHLVGKRPFRETTDLTKRPCFNSACNCFELLLFIIVNFKYLKNLFISKFNFNNKIIGEFLFFSMFSLGFTIKLRYNVLRQRAVNSRSTLAASRAWLSLRLSVEFPQTNFKVELIQILIFLYYEVERHYFSTSFC